MKRVFVCFLLVTLAQAQSTANNVPASQDSIRPSTAERANLLREKDSSLEQVVSRVSPAVVQILVNGYDRWNLICVQTRHESPVNTRSVLGSSSIRTDTSSRMRMWSKEHNTFAVKLVDRDAAQFVAQSESQGATRNYSVHILEWISQERNGMRNTTPEEQQL